MHSWKIKTRTHIIVYSFTFLDNRGMKGECERIFEYDSYSHRSMFVSSMRVLSSNQSLDMSIKNKIWKIIPYDDLLWQKLSFGVKTMHSEREIVFKIKEDAGLIYPDILLQPRFISHSILWKPRLISHAIFCLKQSLYLMLFYV